MRDLVRLRAVWGLLLAVTLIGVAVPVAGATSTPPRGQSVAGAQTIGAGSCIGTNACTGATGNIGAGSCIGEDACRNSTGDIGDNSCNYSGDTFAACEDSSADIGDGSCNVLGACRNATTTIGDGSCNGNGACNGITATVGDGSCNTGTACPSSSGPVANGSCNEFASCVGSAATVGNNACNGTHSCEAHPAGTIADNTCNAAYECSRQPDALIRLAGGALRGNDVYNTDGAGQSAYFGPRKLADGAVRWFYVYAFNDGFASDAFEFSSAGTGSDPGYDVRYLRPSGADITAAVEAGTFVTPDVAPGDRYGIKVKVTITSGAAHGSAVHRLITLTSEDGGQQDAVGLTLTRK
jgi:hypothetical protein